MGFPICDFFLTSTRGGFSYIWICWLGEWTGWVFLYTDLGPALTSWRREPRCGSSVTHPRLRCSASNNGLGLQQLRQEGLIYPPIKSLLRSYPRLCLERELSLRFFGNRALFNSSRPPMLFVFAMSRSSFPRFIGDNHTHQTRVAYIWATNACGYTRVFRTL